MKRKIFSIFFALVLVLTLGLVTAVPAGAVVTVPAITATADRLVALQSTETLGLLDPPDFGWDFVVTNLTEHSAKPSGANLYGVTALGLIDAYEVTGDEAYFTAAQLTADHLKTLIRANDATVRIQSFDYRFLVEFSVLSQDDSYKIHALSEWDWVKANVDFYYADENQGNIYDFWVTHAGYGFAAWQAADCGLATLAMGDTSYAEGMATVLVGHLADIDPQTDIYRFIGWGHALEFLNAVDSTAYATEITGLISNLTGSQNDDGSWGTGENSEGYAQDAAYAIMGLAAVGEGSAAQAGAAWLVANQGYGSIVGGWTNSVDVENSETDSEALQALVAMEEADPMTSYKMHFKGALTVEDGIYSGMIPMINAGGFNVYAREGTSAWFGELVGGEEVWTEVAISNHDAWPAWTPDTPDWYQYSLNLYVEEGVQKWAIRNHPGATATDPWYETEPPKAAMGVPMSGFMDWDKMYAFETDVGAYLPETGTGQIPGGAEANGGGAACWDMDWSQWGSEVVPLQYPGFEVAITGSGPYSVTLTPAPHGVINKALLLPAGWSIVSPDREVTDYHIAYSVGLVYEYGTDPSTGERGFIEATGLDPITPVFIKTTDGGWVGFTYAESSQGIFTTNLEAGWNLIGIPETEATAKAILSPIRLGANNEKALATLVSQGDYNPSGYSFYESMLNLEDGVPTLYPFDGYWAYMNVAKEFGVVVVE